MDPSCKLCGIDSPLYTWRHDSALQTLDRGLKDHVDSEKNLYADLQGMRASDNPLATIPLDILVTSARPDIVIVGRKEVTIIELTIPHNSPESVLKARTRKSEKESYQ